MAFLSSLSRALVRDEQEAESRWPALVALLAVGGLNFALPDLISFGPSWGLLLLIGVLSVPTFLTHRAQKHKLNQTLGYIVNTIETLALMAGVASLVSVLLHGGAKPVPLLQSAVLLWITNVLVFALWYWRLDAGGPHQRGARKGHTSGALLFPQMTFDDPEGKNANWSPHFVDYLFVAFNTSTAFSPTDAPVLSRWAKVLTMLQSSISLTIISLLAARAVNILS